jgi:septal ring factor EnvC (AmiA/AmiB activator)
MILLLFFSSG